MSERKDNSSFDEVLRSLEQLDRTPGTPMPEAVLTKEDWDDYYKELELLRQAQMLGPEAGSIILRSL